MLKLDGCIHENHYGNQYSDYSTDMSLHAGLAPYIEYWNRFTEGIDFLQHCLGSPCLSFSLLLFVHFLFFTLRIF